MADGLRTMPRAFLFDCDGTILDSMGMWLTVQVELLAEYGFKTTPDDFARFESLSMMGECCAYHDTWGIGRDGQEVYDRLMAMLLDRSCPSAQACGRFWTRRARRASPWVSRHRRPRTR